MVPERYCERTAVVLPISDYEKMLEDLDDLAVVAERRDEPTIPHEQFVSELTIRFRTTCRAESRRRNSSIGLSAR